jgi:hypothetical protein
MAASTMNATIAKAIRKRRIGRHPEISFGGGAPQLGQPFA